MPNAQVEKLMKNLGITEAEALDVIAYDKAVDKGEKTEYDLTKEKEKDARKYANVSEHKKSETKIKRAKENPEKEGLVAKLAEFLVNVGENVEITNKSREISFKIGENLYKLTLTATRK